MNSRRDWNPQPERNVRKIEPPPTLPEWARAVGFAFLVAMILFGDAISHAIARWFS